MFFDSDDMMYPFGIESLVERAVQSGAEIIMGRSEELREGKIYPMDWSLRLDVLPQKDVFDYKDLGDYVFGFCIGWAWDKLYKREFVEKHKLYFHHTKINNDLYFVFSSLLRAESMSVCQKILFIHRKHSHSLEYNRSKEPLLFLESLKLWHNELERMEAFLEVKRSYVNWTLHFCFLQLAAYELKEYYQLFRALKKGFYELDLVQPRAYYCYKNFYYQMRYILAIPLWLHSLSGSKICGLRAWFRIKLSKDIKILRLFGITLYRNVDESKDFLPPSFPQQ